MGNINWEDELRAFQAVTGAFADMDRQKMANQEMEYKKQELQRLAAQTALQIQKNPYEVDLLRAQAAQAYQQAASEPMDRRLKSAQAQKEMVESRRLQGQAGLESMVRRNYYKENFSGNAGSPIAGQPSARPTGPAQTFQAQLPGQAIQPPVIPQPSTSDITINPSGVTLRQKSKLEQAKEFYETQSLATQPIQKQQEATRTRIQQLQTAQPYLDYLDITKNAKTMSDLLKATNNGDVKAGSEYDAATQNFFQHMVDPKGVVRETDITRLVGTLPWVRQATIWANQAVKGGTMDPEARKTLVKLANLISDSYGNTYNDFRSRELSQATKLGYDKSVMEETFPAYSPISSFKTISYPELLKKYGFPKKQS